MFGFFERQYLIEKAHEFMLHDETGPLTQKIELRQTLADKRRYISIRNLKLGQLQFDYLLRYDSDKDLDVDWAKLTSDTMVGLDDLSWIERVESHHIGYGRDGSVTVY